MRIQHNIMAMNAYRNFSNNTSALSKNLEKLSSGYKINRAGDDAAGLAISEKMRAQITGLETAQKNSKDGISLIQTAEGALTEVHDMLNRMVELADQSANGTYDNETDRANLQKEFDALRTEIDRIADSSNFNGIKLLDGSLSANGKAGADGAGLDPKYTAVNFASSDPSHISGAQTKSGANETKMVIKYGGTAGTGALTINYKDANGENKSVALSAFAAGDTSAAAMGTKISAELANWANGVQTDGTTPATADQQAFAKLFDVKISAAADGTDQVITFTAKENGAANQATVTGMSTSDSTTVKVYGLGTDGNADVATATYSGTPTSVTLSGGSLWEGADVSNYKGKAAADVTGSGTGAMGVTDLKLHSTDKSTTLNGKKLSITSASGATPGATIDGSGNITVTIDSDSLTSADDLKNAINAVLSAGATGGTTAQQAAWKNVTVTGGAGGTFSKADVTGQAFATFASDGENAKAADTFDLSGTLQAGDQIVLNGKTYTQGATLDNDNRVFTSLAELKTQLENDGYTVDITDTKAVTIKSNAGPKVEATATSTAHDKGYELTLSGAVAGDSVTVGDKTFEFVANAGDKAKDGNIAVVIGGDDKLSASNLVKAMKENGITSASSIDMYGNGTNKVMISDMSQISVAQKGAVGIQSASDGVHIATLPETGGQYDVTVNALGTGVQQTDPLKFELEYMDAEGTKHTITVDNVAHAAGAANDADTVANVLMDHLKNNKEFTDHFEISTTLSAPAASGTLSIKVKDGAGASEITITNVSMKTTGGTDKLTDLKQVSAGAAQEPGKTMTITSDVKAGDTVEIGGKTFQFVSRPTDQAEGDNIAVLIGSTAGDTADALDKAMGKAFPDLEYSYDSANKKFTFMDDGKQLAADGTADGKGGLRLQIGDTSESFNQITVSVDDMHAAALSLDKLSIADQDDAADAVEVIKKAINSVSSTRGGLGALQNRLDHTINNLSVMQENIQDAESNIRDVDVASEMMEYTKNNILIQSAQAMLAQANQVPQGVLQLLQ